MTSGKSAKVLPEMSTRKKTASDAIAIMRAKLASLKNDKAQRRKPLAVEASHEKEHVNATHGEHSWRGRLIHFLHDRPVQLLLTALLIGDILVVMVELFIEAEFPGCKYIVRDAVSCCAADPTTSAATAHHRLLASAAHDAHHSLCVAPAIESANYSVGCDEHKYAAVHTAHDALFYTSVIILAIFLVELLLLLLALGTEFLKNFLYVLDLVVVGGSLGLELTLKSNPSLKAFAEVIILARLWRLVRIGHGLYTTGYDANERHVHELEEQLEKIQELLKEKGITLPDSCLEEKSQTAVHDVSE